MSYKKPMLMTFVDYLLTLLFSFLGLLMLAWLLNFQWGSAAYSAIFTLVLFGTLYSRSWNTAKRDLKNKDHTVRLWTGLKIVLPLTIVNLVMIGLFALIQQNIIPIRDIVVSSYYVFPENEPRQLQNILLIDYLVPAIRIWFSFLTGFMAVDHTSPLILLIAPAVTLAGGGLGYYAGAKKFMLADAIYKSTEKVKEKFNE